MYDTGQATWSAMPAVLWDPAQYLRFSDERSRPFADLLARVRADAPRRVVDLGCGPGELTRLLLHRWPLAYVEGIDSSPEMIERARALSVPGRLDFNLGDVRSWVPESPVDVVVSNATLQWVPGHLDLLGQLVSALAPSGWLAVQVPGNFAAPSHVLLAELRESPRWRGRLGGDARRDLAVGEPADYLTRLTGLGCHVDVWESTYLHVLRGPDAVLEWGKGTALRPVLSALPRQEQGEFLEEYGRALRKAYPAQGFGTVFPFRRIFVVAQRK